MVFFKIQEWCIVFNHKKVNLLIYTIIYKTTVFIRMGIKLKINEIDLFVYFYLQECGFIHSAYTFSQESNLDFLNLSSKIIPPGMLVSLIQRGLAYTRIEMNSSSNFRNKSRSPIEGFFLNKINFFKNFGSKKKKILNQKKTNFFCNNFSIYSFLWHPRKQILFFSSRDSKILKWQTKKIEGKSNNRQILSTFSIPKTILKKIDCTVIDINFTGTLIAVSLNSGEIFFLSETGKILGQSLFSEIPPIDLKFNENSKNLLLSNTKGEIFIFSLWYNQLLTKVSPFKNRAVFLEWIEFSKVTFASKEKLIGGFDLKKKKTQIFKKNSCIINHVSISSDKNFITYSSEGSIYVWSTSPSISFQFYLGRYDERYKLTSWEPKILKKFGRKHIKHFLGHTEFQELTIWNVEKRKRIKKVSQEFCITGIRWCNTGKKIIIYQNSGEISFYDRKGKKNKIFLWNFSNFSKVCIHSMKKSAAFLSKNSIMFF